MILPLVYRLVFKSLVARAFTRNQPPRYSQFYFRSSNTSYFTFPYLTKWLIL